MSLHTFNATLSLLLEFACKTKKESMPILFQKIFIKSYASSLKVNLTDKMVEEIIFYNNFETINTFIPVC